MESHKPAKPNRQTIRLQDYDNSQAGAYFVTNCERGMQHKLGRVHNGEMEYSEIGQIAFDDFHWLEETFDLVEMDIFCIMPNHVHAIKSIIDPGRGDLQTAPTKRKPLGRIDGAYKTHTAVLINKHLNTSDAKFWQRNYYERVIRNQREYDAIWEYIDGNAAKWEEDRYNSHKTR